MLINHAIMEAYALRSYVHILDLQTAFLRAQSAYSTLANAVSSSESKKIDNKKELDFSS